MLAEWLNEMDPGDPDVGNRADELRLARQCYVQAKRAVAACARCLSQNHDYEARTVRMVVTQEPVRAPSERQHVWPSRRAPRRHSLTSSFVPAGGGTEVDVTLRPTLCRRPIGSTSRAIRHSGDAMSSGPNELPDLLTLIGSS